MEKFKTKKEFEEFANDKLIFEEDEAIKLFYQNDYGVYNDSVEIGEIENNEQRNNKGKCRRKIKSGERKGGHGIS